VLSDIVYIVLAGRLENPHHHPVAPCPSNHSLFLSPFIPLVVAVILPLLGGVIASRLKQSIITTLEGRRAGILTWVQEHGEQSQQVSHGDERLDLSVRGIAEIVMDYIELTNYVVSLVVLAFLYFSFFGQGHDLSVPTALSLGALLILGGWVLWWMWSVPRGKLAHPPRFPQWPLLGQRAGQAASMSRVWIMRFTLAALSLPSIALIIMNGG